MAQITENFTLKELTHTIFKFKNEPTAEQVNNLQYLCFKVLQPVRESINQPIHVNSGFRSKELNMCVGGRATSQHTKGEAADITSINNVLLFYACSALPYYDQLIVYSKDGKSIDFIHISITRRRKNRLQLLYCNRLKNRYYSDFKEAFPDQQPFL